MAEESIGEEETGAGSFLVTKVPSGNLYVALRTLEFKRADDNIEEDMVEGPKAGSAGSFLVTNEPSGSL